MLSFKSKRLIYDRRPILKSASTDVIISNKSWSNLRVFSNWRPFQILYCYQIDDLFKTKICVLLPCHIMNVGQVCTSSALHITSNECKTAKFQA